MNLVSILFFGLLLFQRPSVENAIVIFEITHMGVLTIEGTFDELDGDIKKVANNEWLIEGNIDVKSIDTGNASRDKTILTDQYLDAETYPLIPFQAQMSMAADDATIVIDLSLRGIELKLSADLIVEDGMLISVPVILKRSDIGLDFGLMDSLIGDEITIVIDSGIELSDLD